MGEVCLGFTTNWPLSLHDGPVHGNIGLYINLVLSTKCVDPPGKCLVCQITILALVEPNLCY